MAPPPPPTPAMPIDAHHWLCDDAIDWESLRDEAALTRDDSWTGLTRGAAIIFFSSATCVFAGIVAHVTLGFGFGFFSASFALGTIPGLLGALGHRAAEARSLQAGLAWRAAIEQRAQLSSREALSAMLLLMDMAARLDLEAAGFGGGWILPARHDLPSTSVRIPILRRRGPEPLGKDPPG